MTSPFGVGHSCGGATELLLEERHPGTFRSLYLFEPVIFTEEPPSGPNPERDLAVRTRSRRRNFPSRDAAIAAFSLRGPFAALDPACLEAYVDHGFSAQPDGSITLQCEPEDEAEVYVMASAHDGFSRLSSVACPTVIAHGATSKSFTEAHMRTITDRLGDGSFMQWSDMGHFGPLEHPKAFAGAVTTTFLGN
jgi:pimeloyl-ACP methyl ester carboxylesterase